MKRYFPAILIIISLLISAGCSQSPTSPNGTGQWEEATAHAFSTGGRYGLSGTVFNNSMWAIGGAAEGSGGATVYFSDVWSSSSGSSWTQENANAPFSGRYGSQVLSYNGQIWLIGGNSNGTLMNDVWSSSDGVHWTNVLANTQTPGANQFSGREDFGAVVYNNLMWVIGGWAGSNKNDVWSSPDGINWTEATANAAFAGRWGFPALVFGNAMWIIGGAGSTGSESSPNSAYSDVWTSVNGNAWARLSNENSFADLYYSQAVSINNTVWLTAGDLWNDFGPQATFYTSGNGISWTGANTQFPWRFNHLSLVYNNSVWVIGGCDNICQSAPCPTTVVYYNDVWHDP